MVSIWRHMTFDDVAPHSVAFITHSIEASSNQITSLAARVSKVTVAEQCLEAGLHSHDSEDLMNALAIRARPNHSK